MSEFAPPPRKKRVTKRQLKKIQQNYARAQEMAQDFSEQEAEEKEWEIEKLEDKLDDVF